jgi:HSP20 family molecular chaperone IbpA
MKEQDFREFGTQLLNVARRTVTEVSDFMSQQAQSNDVCQRVMESASSFVGNRSDIPIRMVETNEAYYVEAELPGFSFKNVELVVLDDTITVRAKRVREQKLAEVVLKDETSTGEIQRIIKLPEVVDSNQVQASMNGGVLHVVLQRRKSVTVPVQNCE